MPSVLPYNLKSHLTYLSSFFYFIGGEEVFDRHSYSEITLTKINFLAPQRVIVIFKIWEHGRFISRDKIRKLERCVHQHASINYYCNDTSYTTLHLIFAFEYKHRQILSKVIQASKEFSRLPRRWLPAVAANFASLIKWHFEFLYIF